MEHRPPAIGSSSQEILDNWYRHYYSDVVATADGSFFERFIHRSMERRYGPDRHFSRVLEVGANRGEHFGYVRHSFDRYLLTDLRLPDVDDTLRADPRVELGLCDVTRMPYADGSFDRVIATCVLHHVDSVLDAAAEMRRVTAPGGGHVTVFVPTDPGLAYRFGKALTSGRAASRRGIRDLHRLVDAIDHRNHFRSILVQLLHVFGGDEVTVDWYPWRLPSAELNAFVVVHAAVTGG